MQHSLVTEGTRADCKEACVLIDGLSAETLLVDRGYNSNEITDKAINSDCQVVISPKRNRKIPLNYDKELCRV